MILTGIAPPSAPEGPANYVQMKDLDPGRRVLGRGGLPTAGRATPIKSGDVLLTARGERNIAVRPDTELLGAYPTLDIYLLRPDATRLDADYLAAFLNRPEIGSALRASTSGASLPRVPKESLVELDIPLPPLRRQRAIGGLSACAYRQSELSRRLNHAQANLAIAQLAAAFRLIEA